MIILDTNVISEIIKKQPDEHVANWLRNQDTSNLATTAITVAELLAGICRMPEGKRRKYTDTTVKLALMTLEDRTFAFDTQAAADYAHILVEREHRGTPTSIQDAMIAARIQFVSATLVFGLAAFDCSLAISSSHTSLGVL